MKVGDLVKLIWDDVRGTAGGVLPVIPAGTVGIVVFSPEADHHSARPFVKLFGDGGTRPFPYYDLEIINESR
jgi:hypothetical protein